MRTVPLTIVGAIAVAAGLVFVTQIADATNDPAVAGDQERRYEFCFMERQFVASAPEARFEMVRRCKQDGD